MLPTSILLLALLAILAFPVASAAKPLPVEVDPDVQVGGDCRTCVEADLTVAQTYPDNCADCGGVGVHVGAEFDRDNVFVDATVCRGGFVVICLVDEHVVL